jgi:hypothetical protein
MTVNQVCVICGKLPATTKDHIPPKGIFNKPRPNDLITVPACANCNNGASQLDEAFLVNLGLHLSAKGSEGERLFNERVLPTLNHNKRKLKEMLEELEEVELVTPQGIVHGKGYAARWDSEAHDSILERTTRGLVYNHYGVILGEDATVKTHFFHALNDDLKKASEKWALNTVGGDMFVYRYTSATNDDLFATVWLYEFYKGHWAGAQTESKIHRDDI